MWLQKRMEQRAKKLQGTKEAQGVAQADLAQRVRKDLKKKSKEHLPRWLQERMEKRAKKWQSMAPRIKTE